MPPVWLLFKLIETILGMFCMGFHIRGFLNVKEAQEYFLYSCIFFSFIMNAMFGCLNICLGDPPKLWVEAFVNTAGSLMYFYTSLSTMFHAEKDFYLMYLAEFGQPLHPFFAYAKAQSLSALACAIVYMLHAIFVIDLLCWRENAAVITDDHAVSITGTAPPQFYVGGKAIQQHLEKYGWFRKLARLPEQQQQTTNRRRVV